jgi:hypothetical protein
MRKNRCAALILSVAFAATAGITGTAAQAVDEPNPPPRPAWATADGKVDRGKLPRELPVIGPDGKIVKDIAQLKGVRSRVDELPPPPKAR